jgi:probable HAF family extracellular repeat protein
VKKNLAIYIIALSSLAVRPIPVHQAAQDGAHKQAGSHHHYKLIDLGTFGGPISGANGEPTENDILNSAGSIVGGADTSIPTPEPACYNPVLNSDCFIFHAFVWKSEGLKDLGTLPAGDFSFAEGINNRGQIAGVSENGENDPVTGYPEFHAVLWQNDHILDLGTLGGNSSFAGSINDQGQIMGVSLNDVPDPFSIVGLGSMTALTQTRSFLWQRGKMHDLGTLGGPDSFAMFLNNVGEIAGVSYTNNVADPNTGFPHMDPFLWRDGKMQDLGNFGGTNDPFGPSLFVAGLNNHGQVAGFMNLPGDQIAHAFLWDGEKLIDLNASRGGLGGNFSFAAGLNDAGAVIGAATLPGDQVQHAFRWKNGVMTDLGTPAGDVCSQGGNINSIGQIVGASQSAQDCFGRFTHAFLWENGGPSVDLNTLIPPNSPLELTVAGLISDRGEIIGGGDPVGCTNNDACNHVYVLIPCDENHPAVEGCDYSLVEVAAAEEVPPTAAANKDKLSPTELTARVRSSMANRYRGFGTLPRP